MPSLVSVAGEIRQRWRGRDGGGADESELLVRLFPGRPLPVLLEPPLPDAFAVCLTHI